MRKSKNYYKFMEYMAFGISGWHEDAVMVDNGVIECVAYPKVAHIEDYSKLYKCNYDKMTMDSENTWLTIKCVLVNEEVIDVYYVTNECNLYIGQLILDDYRTQKQALDALHKKVVCFFLNSREFCELHPTEEINEYEAIIKPEWHHVSLSTLTNLNFDMLDEKRQLYFSLYGEIKELIKDLHNCKSCHSYEKRLAKMYSRNADLVDENKVTSDYIRYVTRKVSMCNVECGVWTSANEESTGYHKSRRYDEVTLRH